MTEVEDTARNIIGADTLAKLTRASIAVVWARDAGRTCETCRHPGTVSDCDGIWCGQGVVGRINKSVIVGCDEWEANA